MLSEQDKQYQETWRTWDHLAPLYEEKFMDLHLYDASYDYVCRAIAQPHARLLDIGCGPGNITRYLLVTRPDFDILGIDVSPQMTALAQKNNPTSRFAVMDCREIGTLQETFEGIICGFCLPYLSPADAHLLIKNSSALLKEGGLLYLSFVEGDPARSGFVQSSSGHRTYFYYYQLDALITQLSGHQLEVVKIFHADYRRSETDIEQHTMLIAVKKSNPAGA